MKDNFGNAYLRVEDARDGMMVWLDGGFTCAPAGPIVLRGYGWNACFACDDGEHELRYQCDDGEHCIGVYPVPPAGRRAA